MRALAQSSAFDRAAIGEVALEVVGVDLDRRDRAARAEPDQDPVVAGRALAPRLPAAAHVLGPARAAAGCSSGRRTRRSRRARCRRWSTAARSTESARRRVGAARRRAPARAQSRRDAAVDAEARHAAVGEDVQAHVRDRLARRRARTGSARRGGAASAAAARVHVARRQIGRAPSPRGRAQALDRGERRGRCR